MSLSPSPHALIVRPLFGIALLLGLLVPTFGALRAVAPTPQGDQRPGPETQIKDHLDGVNRWMKAQQNRATGAYGDAHTTAWVLLAFGEGPRKYRSGDGPFIQGALDYLLSAQLPDGAFSTDGKTGDLNLSQVATRALYVHLNESRKEAYGKALSWLAKQGIDDPGSALLEDVQEGEAGLRHVRRILATLDKGHWPADPKVGDALRTTARHAVDLARYEKRFRPSSGESAPVVPLGPFTEADKGRVLESMQRGAQFLLQVAEQGKFGAPGRPDAGLTAMVIGGLQGLPEPRDPEVQKIIDGGLEWLVALQHKDGSIHQGRLANYVTSAAIMALSRSPKEAHQAAVKKAQGYLIGLQADEGEGYSEGDRYYGGIGYGGDERPDLSNLQMALDALAASGLEQDHEAYQRAIKFLERCQNRAETNDVVIDDGEVVIVSGDDGGAGYMPGDSKAGFVKLEDGREVPRSYGSMTYALLKSYVLAGLSTDDPRVKAAIGWLQKNYTLDVNPGFEGSDDPRAAYQGLYYYYLSMARALNTLGVDRIRRRSRQAAPLEARIGGPHDRSSGSGQRLVDQPQFAALVGGQPDLGHRLRPVHIGRNVAVGPPRGAAYTPPRDFPSRARSHLFTGRATAALGLG